jgi:hypothetical protein
VPFTEIEGQFMTRRFPAIVTLVLACAPAAAGPLPEPAPARPVGTAAEPDADLGAALKRLRELNAELGAKVDAALAQAEQSAPAIQRELLRLRDEIKRQAPGLQRELETLLRRLEEIARQPAPVETPIEI